MERCDQTRIRPVAVSRAISMIVAITFITCPGTNFTVEQLSVSRRASGGFAALTAEIIPLMLGPTQHGETSRSSGRPIRHLVSERFCVAKQMKADFRETSPALTEAGAYILKMPQRFARFSGSGSSHHPRSLVGFITITSGFRFSIHTACKYPIRLQIAVSKLWAFLLPARSASMCDRCSVRLG